MGTEAERRQPGSDKTTLKTEERGMTGRDVDADEGEHAPLRHRHMQHSEPWHHNYPYAPHVQEEHHQTFADFMMEVRVIFLSSIFTIIAPILSLGWTTLSWRRMAIFWSLYLVTQNIPPYYSRHFFKWRWGGGCFKEFSKYFCHIKFIKEEPLDPSNAYIIGWHPHGRVFMGIGAFIGNMLDWLREMDAANKRVHIGINDTMFRIPFINIWLTLIGLVPVNNHHVRKVLSDGDSVCIIVGGTEEVLLGTYDDHDVLYLQDRKGFAKIAMENGAGLVRTQAKCPSLELITEAQVPVYCFGENSLYSHSSPASLGVWRWVNKFIKLGAPFPIYGRWGLPLPFRRPMLVAMGKPIFAGESESLSEFHARYIEALKTLYASHVGSTHDPKRRLVIK